MTEAIAPTRPAGLSTRLRPLFTFTILLGSFLLFLMQPMFGRSVLPVLGGSPSVWNTAMLFYQVTLLAGYLYAHALSRLAVRRQLAIHLAVFAAAALTLPIAIARWYPAAAGSQTLWLIGLLAVSIGPVFFTVSAQAPLMQSWFARSSDRDAANPYFLYAASNFGSFAALVAYPLLVEPFLRLGHQSLFWSAGFVCLGVLVALCGLAVGQGSAAPAAATPSVITWTMRGRWTLLAFIASALLLSTTTHLTTDIMAMPLLWVVPLGVYLLSFVLAFAARGAMYTRIAVRLAPPALLLFGSWACLASGPAAATIFAAAGILLLFIVALALHGTLAQERPGADALTDFYLWLSVGGALGGVFCALVAPQIFRWPFEHPLLLVTAALVVPAQNIGPWAHRLWARPGARFACAVLALVASASTAGGLGIAPAYSFARLPVATILVVLALAAVAVTAIGRRGLFAWIFAMIIMALGGWYQTSRNDNRERSFFGVYTIEDRPSQFSRTLLHGTTMHGQQSLVPALAAVPMTYYAPQSGVGLAMAAAPRLYGPAARIGFVGLGTGTLSCYAVPGQRWIAYEIDPVIVRIARQRFSYVSRCNPDLAIVIGDARLTLAKAPAAGLNILAVDAFSSDAIPLHLVTREAFRVYGRALDRDGLLLVHVSNRFLDLEPMIAAIAAQEGWTAVLRDYHPGVERPGEMFSASTWIALSRNPERLDALQASSPAQDWRPVQGRSGVTAWSDDFASVLPILKFKPDIE
ncbi:fused MFS/spermidine synthase [Polymorphobacter fuscus]|uniref:fused MFS/spermidine synthase n=1 Tax=Sandarakinorhabdus fusca TaxID=1439888 RepID=UPI00169DC00E|nr:spermidine synthase [Polymorphobacter fuscus]